MHEYTYQLLLYVCVIKLRNVTKQDQIDPVDVTFIDLRAIRLYGDIVLPFEIDALNLEERPIAFYYQIRSVIDWRIRAFVSLIRSASIRSSFSLIINLFISHKSAKRNWIVFRNDSSPIYMSLLPPTRRRASFLVNFYLCHKKHLYIKFFERETHFVVVVQK